VQRVAHLRRGGCRYQSSVIEGYVVIHDDGSVGFQTFFTRRAGRDRIEVVGLLGCEATPKPCSPEGTITCHNFIKLTPLRREPPLKRARGHDAVECIRRPRVGARTPYRAGKPLSDIN